MFRAKQKSDSPENEAAVLRLANVSKTYVQGASKLEILKGVNLSLRPGEMVALLGPSGSGKSTLLQVAGLLDKADGGEIEISSRDATRLSDNERTKLRLKYLGFVYQFHHLLPEFSALENVMMPLLVSGMSKKQAASRAEELLVPMGLKERLSHRPARLSGGEQQRVAIARALANRPALVLADEPTGNLDPATAEKVFQIFLQQAREQRVALLMATHNMELARRMDRIVSVQDARLKEMAA
jgi:lipoprotein-releasing system ATP-binding protein